MTKCTEQSFLKDVAAHEMTVLREDGIYRHVRFKKPGTNIMYFDLMTWPGWLCYSGDMGTYVFRRLEDMFEFFRTDRLQPKNGQSLFINLGYWSEKLESVDRTDGVTEYSPKLFIDCINELLDESDTDDDLRQAVQDGILAFAEDGEQAARSAAYRFTHGSGAFFDLTEHSFQEYVYRFVWCCYAIAWGIQKYDRAKEAKP